MLSLLSGNWRFLAFSLLLGILVAVIFFLNSQNNRLSAALKESEQSRAQWEALAVRQNMAIEGLQDNTLACMEREAKAYEDAKQREDILNKASTRSRTQTEEKEVVDDETRKAVVNRLNRSL